jgi:TonB family protein
MTDRKRCIRCGRAIDAWAGTCPFCNWSQTVPPPDAVAPRAPATQYRPPEEMNVRKLIGIGSGAVLTLMLAFLMGMAINRDGAPKRAPEHNTEILEPMRADTPLVPAGEGGIENKPITSAPIAASPGQIPDEYQRSDATAVSADEYARMAKRAQAEKKNTTVLVDPRSLTGPAYAQGRPPVNSGEGQTPTGVNVRTRPVPRYQPIPPLHGSGKARFTLVIGTDGRVKDVNVERMLSGSNNAALLGAIQSWRFKPATENGEPVAAPYSVEISFTRE